MLFPNYFLNVWSILENFVYLYVYEILITKGNFFTYQKIVNNRCDILDLVF